MKKAALPITVIALTLLACDENSSGSVSDYAIKDDVYTQAYDRKFSSKADRGGWPQDVQLAWSRGGAALACGVPVNKDQYLAKLDAKFPDVGKIMHDLNGLQFHELQIQKNSNFCTEARKAEAQSFVSSF